MASKSQSKNKAKKNKVDKPLNKQTVQKNPKKVIVKEPEKLIKSVIPDSEIQSSENILAPAIGFNLKFGDVSKPSQKKNKDFISALFSRFVGEDRELKKYWEIVKKIESFDGEMKKKSDQELKAKTQEFRDQLKGLNDVEIEKKLKDILPEAFAVVREAAHRVLGEKHYPVQMIAAMVLHDGRVAEMKTGEGKTLSSTLAVYLNALPENNQVHLVTVNDYLARRDASWMGRVYNFLGLSIGVIQNQASFYFKLGVEADDTSESKRKAGRVDTYEDGKLDDSRAVLDVEHLVHCDRKRAYFDPVEDKIVDIVYGVNSEYGFDYLRDNMASVPEEMVQVAGQVVAVVDEVDSILIDEARTPLIISSQDSDSSARYQQMAKIVQKLTADLHYEVDEKRKIVTLTDLGVEKVEQMLSVNNLYGTEENVILIHHLDQALKAKALFKREKEYVVKDNEIIIVDENTGRLMFGRRYSQGLHQAIEAKEDIEVKAESKTVATITFQNYFRLYKKLSGMTGTASTESEELFKIYKLLVVTIPTNKSIIRDDRVDKIFKTEMGKYTALIRDIREIHKTGQPILIGTTSIEKNQLVSKLLNEARIPHQILNAKNHEQEAKIISEAGTRGAVTLATNIAGRGVDIKLGGEPPEDLKKKEVWRVEHEAIKKLGGLFVLATERHESRRIDNQLRGRAGRQGDPGVSQFYVSLDDYVIRVFGGDRVGYFQRILPVADDEAIQNKLLARTIEESQKKIEGQYFDQRKYVTEYDDVINRQREVIYARRRSVLLNQGFDHNAEIKKTLYREIFEIIKNIKFLGKKKQTEFVQNLSEASKNLNKILKLEDFDSKVLEVLLKDNRYNYSKVAGLLTEKLEYQLQQKWELYEERAKSGLARFVFLRAIDLLWTEHLVTISQLQDSVRLRGYSQKDPLVEFKQDGMSIFMSLLLEIDREISRTIFKVSPELVPKSILEG
jgi:preprotein translocase subunit SecA